MKPLVLITSQWDFFEIFTDEEATESKSEVTNGRTPVLFEPTLPMHHHAEGDGAMILLGGRD